MTIIKELTDDGSNTLYVPSLDEHYHSTKGAKTESKHIFIKEGLLHRNKNRIKVLEIGFGTGLNAYETLCATNQFDLEVEFHTLELYPLNWADVQDLEYSRSDEYKTLITSKWNKEYSITDRFKITKHHFDFTQLELFDKEENFDVVYFDAFAPEKQPEMWSQELFNKLYVLLSMGGILTTYCAKGNVRRMLLACGFKVERIPGPPGGKREILRATKI